MIKRIRKYFILSVVALLATSCLDKYPEDAMLADEAINTVDDANLAVIVYTMLSRALLCILDT